MGYKNHHDIAIYVYSKYFKTINYSKLSTNTHTKTNTHTHLKVGRYLMTKLLHRTGRGSDECSVFTVMYYCDRKTKQILLEIHKKIAVTNKNCFIYSLRFCREQCSW